MASEPYTLEPRLPAKYRYRWHSAAFLVAVFGLAIVALVITIVSSRASSTPLLDDKTMSAARELATTQLPRQVPLAAAGDLQITLPIFEQEVTAIGFHPVDDENVVALNPIGHQANGSFISSSIAGVISSDGPDYYVMGEGGRLGSETRALDVGAPAGTPVFAPVDGSIAGIKSYQLKGQCTDTEIMIEPNSQSRLLVVLTHIDQTEVSLGQPIRAGVTRLGAVRKLDDCLEQSLGRYTYDNGNHLQMQVEIVR